MRSFVVPLAFREQAVHHGFTYGNFHDDVGFEEEGVFELGDLWLEDNGVPFERIVRLRRFDGWPTRYYEPVDRFVACEGLHRENNGLWQNPLDRTPIVQGETWPEQDGETQDWQGALIKIRQAELRDYLAARRSGLLVLRFFERGIVSRAPIGGLPDPFEKPIENGRFQWIRGEAGDYLYHSVIEDTHWLGPTGSARRRGAAAPDTDPVEFLLRDGTRARYQIGGDDDRYFEPITFSLEAVKRAAAQPGASFEMSDLTQGTLRLRDGGSLRGVVMPHAQFQCMFADVHQLSIAQQEHFAAHCEIPKQERLYSDDFVRASIEGKFPTTRPLEWTMRSALLEINESWRSRFGEALFEDPAEGSLAGLLGASGPTMGCLVEEMLDLQKAIIAERNPTAIKSGLDLSALAPNAAAYKSMKTLKYCRLLFQKFAGGDRHCRVLSFINEARNIKSHRTANTIEQLLPEYDLSQASPRAAYLQVMARMLVFLAALREATEAAFGVVLAQAERELEQDPWQQLGLAVRYLTAWVRVIDPPHPGSPLDQIATDSRRS